LVQVTALAQRALEAFEKGHTLILVGCARMEGHFQDLVFRIVRVGLDVRRSDYFFVFDFRIPLLPLDRCAVCKRDSRVSSTANSEGAPLWIPF
jgi:hypothetical protein